MEQKKYHWDQQINEIHIWFEIDPNLKDRKIKHKIVNRNIEILFNGEVIVKGELLKNIKRDTDYWVINENVVDFYVDKAESLWWDSLLVDSEKVDTSKLAEESRNFDCFDPEAQAAIEKMMFEMKNKKNTNGN